MNRLYYGDNLEVLRRLHAETVDLCYIDPPFNSKRNYNQIYNNIGGDDRAQAQAFTDTWTWDDQAQREYHDILSNTGSRYGTKTIELIKGLRNVLGEGSLLAYLVGITARVTEMHRVLKPTGNFFLHCDPTASHYLKLVLDGIFCGNGTGDFKNEIIWRRTGSHNARRRFGPIHDVILFYTKSNKSFFNIVKKPYMKGHVERRYTFDETTGQYKFTSGGNVLTGAGTTNGESGRQWKGFDPSSKNRHWAVPGFLAEQMGDDFKDLSVLEKLDALYDEGLIDITKDNAWPTPVRFLTKNAGSPIQDIWSYQPYTEGTVYDSEEGIDADVEWLGPTSPERIGFETQKPHGLLDRIIRSACPEGGVVLDAYCGCGTTVAVAQQLKRQWIGMDITFQSISLILKRLEDTFGKVVAEAVSLDGVPKDMASAVALANKKDDRLRKEFEKWAVLTYTRNRAAINSKKGADAGIDGTAYCFTSKNETDKIVFQVKSGGVSRGDVAKLKGDMAREQAAIGVLITLEPSTQPMLSEAKSAGLYSHVVTGLKYDRVQIVTVKEILEQGRRMELPLTAEILAAARPSEDEPPQTEFTLEPGVRVAKKKAKMVKASLPLGFRESKPAKRKRRA